MFIKMKNMKLLKKIFVAAVLCACPLVFAQAAGKTSKTIAVSTAEEFIKAIGSDRTIVLDYAIFDVTEYITKLHELKAVDSYYDAADAQPGKSPVCAVWGSDGIELCIVGVKNLTIKSAFGDQCPRIVAEPRYANTLSFSKCEGISLENLVMGHIEGGYCTGGVLRFNDCKDITIRHCELFGCGIEGIEAYNTEKLLFERSQIRDCTYSIMTLVGCTDFVFRNSDFFRCCEYDLLEVRDCSKIVYENCDFFDNIGTLFNLGSPIKMVDCHVNHPFDKMGNYVMVEGSVVYAEPCGRHTLEYNE